MSLKTNKWNEYELKNLFIFRYLLAKPYTFNLIEKFFNEDAKCENRTIEALRKKSNSLNFTENQIKYGTTLKNDIFEKIKKNPYTVKEISSFFDLMEPVILSFIQELSSSGIPINIIDSGHIVYNKSGSITNDDIKNFNININIENDKEIIFGVVSDTHFGSKSCEINKLNYFYEYCNNLGIRHVLHAGDLLDGIKVYKGQEYEQTHYGFQSQCDLVIQKYPKYENIKTYAILGNHDYSFISLCDSDPFDKICMYRKDIIYTGKYFGELQLGSFKLAMHHPDSGLSYAMSYKIQKILESVKTYYDGYIVGHYHQAISLFNYHSNWSCLAGSFQNETMFSRRKGLKNVLGGFVVKMIRDPIGNVFVQPTWIDCSKI